MEKQREESGGRRRRESEGRAYGEEGQDSSQSAVLDCMGSTAGFFFFHFCIFIYIIFPKIYDISYP